MKDSDYERIFPKAFFKELNLNKKTSKNEEIDDGKYDCGYDEILRLEKEIRRLKRKIKKEKVGI